MKAFGIGWYSLVLMAVSAISALAGSPQGAEQIVKEQRVAVLEWRQQLLTASTPEEKARVLAKQPDYTAFGRRMVAEIGASLQQTWSLPYIVWVVREHPALGPQDVLHLMGFVEQYHSDSAQVGEFCIAIVAAGEGDPQLATKMKISQEKTRFITQVMKTSRSQQAQGQAALALSGMLARRGDDPLVNRQRLELIRKAIIDAAEAKVGETTVAELAKEEIYRMSKLSKGVVAPALIGLDASGWPMKLEDSRGKIVVLIFWSSWEQAERVIEFAKKIQQTYAGQPVEVIGVNRDSLGDLRKLVAAAQSVGKSFSDPDGELFEQYRVTHAPYCCVLDKEGRIQFSGVPGSFVDFTVSALLAPEK